MMFFKVLPFFLLITNHLFAASPVILGDLDELSWQMQPFHLAEEANLRIEATAHFSNGDWHAKGWILDVVNKRVVWEMRRSNIIEMDRSGQCRIDETIVLPAGEYEIHFANSSRMNWRDRNFTSFLGRLFGDHDRARDLSHEWRLVLQELDSGLNKMQLTPPWRPDDLLVDLTGAGDYDMIEETFQVEQETAVHIMMIGEGRRSSRKFYDYGWIVDLDTRRRVWQAKVRDSQHAGGADKNRIIDERHVLPPGNYKAVYITDDSHSLDGFNAMPPYDASRWGMWIRGDLNLIQKGVDLESLPRPVVDLTRVRDDEFLSQGFRLLESTDLRIFAVGEMGYSKTLVDKGWIVDAYTQHKVWEMTSENTFHAGGALKNVMADDVIRLPSGAYKVYYRSDDSHSFEDWNSEPPFEQESWGIAVYPVNKNDEENIQAYQMETDPDLLVSLTRIGDDQRVSEIFTLDQSADISIYAMGEGDRDEMYDYGWIENQQGRIVWRLNFRESSHAGGAKKNRMYSGFITLPAGRYRAFYQTDDSHSFMDWNAAPPEDPSLYGLTISRIR
ncbi:hypothetical protein GF406_03820 [candidate division KSB1 bacterium]|nr:hypothetical protein [candidate division KSB1 bacterium]